jgi:hypothetical protein
MRNSGRALDYHQFLIHVQMRHREKTAAAKADRMLVTLHVNSNRVKRQDHGIASPGRSCKRTRDIPSLLPLVNDSYQRLDEH